MPAAEAPPTLAAFLNANARAINGTAGATVDTRRGSAYDLLGGAPAVLWSRQAQRVRRLFRNSYTETATGPDLERHVEAKYGGVQRVAATFGQGFLGLRRPSVGSAVGRIDAGTRVEVRRDGTLAVYAVTEDTDIQAADLTANIPIRATRTGTGTAVEATAEFLRIADPIFDATLVPTGIVCADGTDDEAPEDYVARARQTRQDGRVGYPAAIIRACQAAGADEVVVLDAGAFGAASDKGLNYVYVADSKYSTSAELKKACFLALEAVRVLGADTQVLGMTQASLSLSVAITLWGDVASFDLLGIQQEVVAALVSEFARRQRWWVFRLDALAGIVQKASRDIQKAVVTSSPGETAASFPAVLTRYALAAGDITLTFQAPT